MKTTSAEANKLLRQYQEEKSMIIRQEAQAYLFIAATTEKVEDARPSYDYEDVLKKLDEADRRIRAVKHAISVFNTTQVVPGFDMTIDQLLVYIPQLETRKNRLQQMAVHPEKSRLTTSSRSNIIEYEYANYDIEKAQADLRSTAEEIARAQLALEQLNTSVQFEIEL